MGYAVAPGQIPLLCKACGAPLGATETLVLTCGFCGAHDRLPANELDRALELKRRLRRAAGAAVQLDGVEAALATIFESPRAIINIVAPALALAGLVAVLTVVQLRPVLARTPAALHAGLIVQGVASTGWADGVVLAVVLGLVIGRAHYRRRVRPLVGARPPKAPGGPARCRACNADLPDGRGPLLRCRYCETSSLVTPELQRSHEKALARDEAALTAGAQKLSAATARASMASSRVVTVVMVASYLVVVALFKISSLLLG